MDIDLLARFGAVALLVIGAVHYCAWALSIEFAKIPDEPTRSADLLAEIATAGGWIEEPSTPEQRRAIRMAEDDGFIRNDGPLGTGYVLTRRGQKALKSWSQSGSR